VQRRARRKKRPITQDRNTSWSAERGERKKTGGRRNLGGYGKGGGKRELSKKVAASAENTSLTITSNDKREVEQKEWGGKGV